MYKYLLSSLMLFALANLTSQETTDIRLKGLDRELDSILADFNVAGFSVAVVDKNQTIYAKGFGYRDYDNKLPATAQTLYAIGSCSKAFTSSLLGILRDEKKIEFDKSPREYLPELKFYNDEMNNSITIKDMMCHRTGLPRHDISWYLFPSNSQDSLIRRIEHQEPTLPVRAGWQYNNFMFMAQGAIAERLTGKSWEDLIRQELFEPLNMNRSNFTIDQLEASKDRSLGYVVNANGEIENTDYYRIRAMGPAGSINSSVTEMAEWVKMWINNGAKDDQQIIPKIYRDEAISSQMSMGGGPPNMAHPDLHLSSYGYGWMMSSYRGHYRVEHGGGIDGFTASTCFFPTDSLGIIVLVNQGGSRATAIIRNIIADRILELPSASWKQEELKQMKEAKESAKTVRESMNTGRQNNTAPSHDLTNYEGLYINPGYGSLSISTKNDSLFATLPETELWLKHFHYDIFQAVEIKNGIIDTSQMDIPQLLLHFSYDLKGEINSLKIALEAGLDPIEFDKKVEIIGMESSRLEQYVGDYSLSGVTVNVYINDGTTLYISVLGQPPYELAPTGEHQFTFVNLEGFDLKFTSENGNISALTFLQPNGNFTAVKK